MVSNAEITSSRRSGLLHNWKYVLATTNPPPGPLDPVSKWLYLTRAGVLPMTLVAAAVAGSAGHLPGRERRVGLVCSCGRRDRARAHGQQPDERPVRSPGRHRPRGLPAQPLLAASGALGRDHAQGPRALRARGERDLPGDHDRAHGGARVADHRLRARRVPAVECVHRAAVALEEARPRRTDRARRVGSADGRRHLLRGDTARSPVRSCSRRCPTRCCAPPC